MANASDTSLCNFGQSGGVKSFSLSSSLSGQICIKLIAEVTYERPFVRRDSDGFGRIEATVPRRLLRSLPSA
jgi:hypothetical protein